jgi:hypothetical protein
VYACDSPCVYIPYPVLKVCRSTVDAAVDAPVDGRVDAAVGLSVFGTQMRGAVVNRNRTDSGLVPRWDTLQRDATRMLQGMLGALLLACCMDGD